MTGQTAGGRAPLQGHGLWLRWGSCRAVRAEHCDLTVFHKVHGAGLRIYTVGNKGGSGGQKMVAWTRVVAEDMGRRASTMSVF